MLPDDEVFVGTVVSITSIRDDPWIVVFVGSLISWSSPYISHTSRSVSLFVLSSRSKFRLPRCQSSLASLCPATFAGATSLPLICRIREYGKRDVSRPTEYSPKYYLQ